MPASSELLDRGTGHRVVDAGNDDERIGALDGHQAPPDEIGGHAPRQLDLEDLRHGPSLGILGAVMSSVLWFVGALVVCAALVYLAYRIEPHWVAKDASRFLTTSETIDHQGKVVSRRREVRGTIMNDGLIMLGKRTLVKTRSSLWRPGPRARRSSTAGSSTSSTRCPPTRSASS